MQNNIRPVIIGNIVWFVDLAEGDFENYWSVTRCLLKSPRCRLRETSNLSGLRGHRLKTITSKEERALLRIKRWHVSLSVRDQGWAAQANWSPWEHLFVCPGGIYHYVPVTSWYVHGRVPSRFLVCLPRILSSTMSLSALIGGARCPLAEEIEACIRHCPKCADRFGSGHSGYADCMRAHPSRCKQTRSVYPDVPTGTFGTCKQVLPVSPAVRSKAI